MSREKGGQGRLVNIESLLGKKGPAVLNHIVDLLIWQKNRSRPPIAVGGFQGWGKPARKRKKKKVSERVTPGAGGEAKKAHGEGFKSGRQRKKTNKQLEGGKNIGDRERGKRVRKKGGSSCKP